jgi:ABC-type transporter Mla subunit MlaD
MPQDNMLIVVLVLVAIAVVLQAWAMVGVWVTMRKIPGQIESVRSDVKQRLDPLAQSVTEIVANSREPVRNISTNLAEISRILRDRTGQLDATVAEMVDRSRLQVIRVDQMISSLVDKVETTSDVVQKNVLAPIQEVAAIVKGVRTGLEFLFSRRRSASVTDATQDEQMFI